MINVQNIPSGQLLSEYRDIMLALGADRGNAELDKRAIMYEVEIDRRMAW